MLSRAYYRTVGHATFLRFSNLVAPTVGRLLTNQKSVGEGANMTLDQ